MRAGLKTGVRRQIHSLEAAQRLPDSLHQAGARRACAPDDVDKQRYRGIVRDKRNGRWRGLVTVTAAVLEGLPEGLRSLKNLYTRKYGTDIEAAKAVDR